MLTIHVKTARCLLCKERQRGLQERLGGIYKFFFFLFEGITHMLRASSGRLQICLCRHLHRLLLLSRFFWCVCVVVSVYVCQIKLVGLNELLQPTAAVLGDRESDKIAPNRGILLKASTSSCVISGQMCSQLIWNDMGGWYAV